MRKHLLWIVILCLGSLAAQDAARIAAPNFVIVLHRGPKWIAGKGVREQPLAKHGQYLKGLLEQGKLVQAGPFLDDQGGLILLSVASEAEARRIYESDPGVVEQILEGELHPIRFAFDANRAPAPARP